MMLSFYLTVRLSVRLSPVFPNVVRGLASGGFSYRPRYTCLLINLFIINYYLLSLNYYYLLIILFIYIYLFIYYCYCYYYYLAPGEDILF